MKYGTSLELIAEAIKNTDPCESKHFVIVWRNRFEVLPHDGHTHLFKNEFAMLTPKEIREGLTPAKWELIKSRIIIYRKEQLAWDPVPKP